MAGDIFKICLPDFKGDLDDIRIYNRDLNASEILQLDTILRNHEQFSTHPNITSQPVADQNATIGSNVTLVSMPMARA